MRQAFPAPASGEKSLARRHALFEEKLRMAHSSVSRPIFLAALPALVAATSLPAFAQAAPLKIGATANDTYAQPYYAQDEGYFTKAGLAVDITTFTNGASVAAAVASGAIDIGISNPVQLANAISRGIPFVCFAGGALYLSSSATTVLCVAKDAPYKTAKDLAGQAIAVSALKDVTDLAKTAYLEKNGVDPATVKTIELPFAEMGPALARGTVAAAVMSEPAQTNSLTSGQTRIFAKVFDAIGPRFLISTWFTTRDWYAKNTALAKRYAAVMYSIGAWCNTNHDQSAVILSKYSRVTLETARAITRCTFSDTINAGLIDPMLQLANKAKITEKLVTASQMIVT